MSQRSRLLLCFAASFGVHASIAGGAALLRHRLTDDYRTDAPRTPLQAQLALNPPPPAALPSPTQRTLAPASSGGDSPYYGAREVDVRARPLGEIQIANPDLTGTQRGIVVLKVLVNAEGRVDNVVVVRAEPYHTFGPGLLTPFLNARFSPARKGGLAVKSQLLVEVRYGERAPAR
jgi:TonB family protein